MTTASRLVRVIGLAAAVALLLPAAALAAPPEHAPTAPQDLVLPAGEFCEHAVLLSTPSHNLHDTIYAPRSDGSVRVRSRGMADSRATDLLTGAAVNARGGSSLLFRFAADGSTVVTGTGTLFAWYLPGDDSDLGPGLFLIRGRIQEVYDADGNFVSSRFKGNSLDVCEALGD